VMSKQPPAMRAMLELRQLIGRQRRIEVMHDFRVGMAARTKLHNPGSIFLPIFLWPLLDEIVAKIRGGIATVAASTREAASKMNVLDNFLQIHMRRELTRAARNRKEIVRRLRFGVGVTQNASVLQEHFHFLRTQLQPEQSCQVLRTRDHLLLNKLVEERAKI